MTSKDGWLGICDLHCRLRCRPFLVGNMNSSCQVPAMSAGRDANNSDRAPALALEHHGSLHFAMRCPTSASTSRGQYVRGVGNGLA
jgi:hypothetical protein